jgi:hypothetical protein
LLSSLLARVRLADLGIGSGLISAITGALGSDLARAHVSTAIALLTAISVVLGLFIVLVWSWIDWSTIFGIGAEDARRETPSAIAASIAIFLLAFPLSVVGTSYNAVQEGKLANYWGMAGNITSLLALIIVTHTRGGLVWLVIAVSGAGLAMNILSGIRFLAAAGPI